MVVTALPRRRPIHSRGAVFEATFRSASVLPELAHTVFDDDAPQLAQVRISQAFGLLPMDFVGLAVRLIDVNRGGVNQDFILVSSSPRPVLRRLPIPITSVFSDAFFCSGTSYAVAGGKVLLGARFRGAGGPPWHPLLVRPLASAGVIELFAATARGPWRLVAELELGPLAAERDLLVRFNPAVGGRGFTAVGRVNRLRSAIYQYFQAGVANPNQSASAGDDVGAGGLT
jgi:hypothetical protein